jgi:hypothetical protein
MRRRTIAPFDPLPFSFFFLVRGSLQIELLLEVNNLLQITAASSFANFLERSAI